MEESLTVLYTANIRGDLAMLPRLYTFIQRLRHDHTVPQTTAERLLLLDLGGSCAPGIWHCDATEGRSTLIALDGMGYHAANVMGLLTAQSRARLPPTMRLALVDENHSWQDRNILVTCASNLATPAGAGQITIILTGHNATHLDQNTLYLASVNAGQVGLAQVHTAHDGQATLTAHSIHTLPPHTPPNPTIAATVDFILSEARHYQRKRAR
jgi:hypothetical protein